MTVDTKQSISEALPSSINEIPAVGFASAGNELVHDCIEETGLYWR